MLDVRRLWILREVARFGSFTAAAQSLSYTPSAVSQQIATFEREVGTALVERSARGVALTEPGRLLVNETETIFGHLSSVERELRSLVRMESGMLRLGWFATAGGSLVSRAIAAFRQRYPNIELDLFEGDPDECVPGLLKGDIGLALVYQFDFEPPLRGDLVQVDLLDDPIHIGLPKGHPLAERERLSLSELAHEHWIQGVQRGSTREVLPQACQAAGFDPTIVLRTGDRTVIEGLIAAGAGVALVPNLTLPIVRDDIVVRPLDSELPLSRTVRAALAPASHRSPTTAAMLEVLREICTGLGEEAQQRLSRS